MSISMMKINIEVLWLQLFTRLNQLNLCVGEKATRTKIDQIKKECNKELKQWKSTVVKQWQNKGKFTVVLLKAL